MALRDQPYLPLYIQDIMTDEKLNECSASTHGIYIKGLMCLMHKSEQYGKLLLKQKYKQTGSMSRNFALMLVKHLPYSIDEIEKAIDELIKEKVCYFDEDYLCQKRMIKDNSISEARSKAGKKGGGNPSFVSTFVKTKSQTNTENEYENEYEINIKKGTIKNLCKKEDYDQVVLEFEKWKDYLAKQHNVSLLDNEYTWDILIDAIQRVKDGNIIKSINYSISSNFKKIYAFKEDSKQQNNLSHLNQAAKKDTDY